MFVLPGERSLVLLVPLVIVVIIIGGFHQWVIGKGLRVLVQKFQLVDGRSVLSVIVTVAVDEAVSTSPGWVQLPFRIVERSVLVIVNVCLVTGRGLIALVATPIHVSGSINRLGDFPIIWQRFLCVVESR